MDEEEGGRHRGVTVRKRRRMAAAHEQGLSLVAVRRVRPGCLL
jgi:hypothetical protein